MQRGVTTNLMLGAGLASFLAGKSTRRLVFCTGGTILFGIGLFRIAWFDLLWRDPLLAYQEVGGLPLFNGLLLPFGLPILWVGAFARTYGNSLGRALTAVQPVLLFALVTMELRQAFHGSVMRNGSTSDGEIYAYSAVWLVTGFALLGWGLYQASRDMRLAALAVMIVTITKACLYDAGELTGLLRVASFLALGLGLLGLGWLYTRFVFPKVKTLPPADQHDTQADVDE